MPFSIRPFRRFPVQCSVTYNAGPFQGQGTVWNLSLTGWRLREESPRAEAEAKAKPGQRRSAACEVMATA